MKRTMGYIIIVLISIVVYGTINLHKSSCISSLTKANIEALAGGESGGYPQTCYHQTPGSALVLLCQNCAWGYSGTSNKSTCD